MGRIQKFRTLVFGCALLVAIGNVPSDLTLPATNTASAQTLPAITIRKSGARDANTFQSDRALDAACRKSGQNSAICLCVTHVMKYELPLKPYKAATRLYGQPENRTQLHKKLMSEGYKRSDIEMAETKERTLINSDDFAMRCANAKSYYRHSAR